ncbi:MAG: hypothetical protein MUF18_16380 [Fimbriiglobus sp.]|jgi:hypothetical protein|nr:hypothetical protein [Fimbriiglobus sp.]
MATFYLIPPRECLEQAFADFLARVLPGVPVEHTVTETLLSAIEFEANRTGDVYLLHREDLPGGRDTVRDLVTAFGAEPGDTVVEIGTPAAGRTAPIRRCTILAAVSDSPAVS